MYNVFLVDVVKIVCQEICLNMNIFKLKMWFTLKTIKLVCSVFFLSAVNDDFSNTCKSKYYVFLVR